MAQREVFIHEFTRISRELVSEFAEISENSWTDSKKGDTRTVKSLQRTKRTEESATYYSLSAVYRFDNSFCSYSLITLMKSIPTGTFLCMQ